MSWRTITESSWLDEPDDHDDGLQVLEDGQRDRQREAREEARLDAEQPKRGDRD